MATYTIKSGDTLGQLAREFGTSVSALARANNISNPDLIYAGNTLTIPGGGGGGKDSATREEEQMLASMAGTTVAFFRSNNELSKLFDKAIDENYAPQRLLAEARNTKWYKRHSQAQRQAQVLKQSDPDEYRRRVQSTKSKVRQIGRDLGISLANKNLERSLNHVATRAFVNGWSNIEIRRYLGRVSKTAEIVRRGGSLGGELGRQYSALREYAANQGVRVSNKQWGHWMQKLAQHSATAEHIQASLEKRAISAFPGLKDEIKGGQTVREFADQYIQSMADVLELNESDIDVFNRDIKQALNAKNKDGKFSPLTLTDFEIRLQKDPRWLKTRNARESLMGAGREILSAFGVSW